MNKELFSLIFSSALLSISGCASYSWTNDNGSANWNVDQGKCMARGYRSVKVQTPGGGEDNCNDSSDPMCGFYQGMNQSASQMNYYSGLTAQKHIIEGCLAEKGWYKVRN